MKALRLPPVSAAMSALLVLAAGKADAGPNPWPNGVPTAPPAPQGGMHGFHGGMHGGFHGGFGRGFFGNGFVIYEEPEVVHDIVVVHDTPAAQPVALEPPPPPRDPYVIGRTYSSLPGGCMKMIEGGASYFHCSGEWYREVGSRRYKAVSAPL